MKKLLLVIAIVAAGFTANAQKAGFNVGANATYNFDGESFGLMGEANYLFEVSESFRIGPSISYGYSFGSDITTPSVSVGGITIPSTTVSTGGGGSFVAAAAARFDASEEFVIGADLGVNLDASVFYYRPLVGYRLNENTMVQLSYPATTGGGNLALGVMFGL